MKVSRTSLFKNIYFYLLILFFPLGIVLFFFTDYYSRTLSPERWERIYIFNNQTYNSHLDRIELVRPIEPSAVLIFTPNGRYYYQRLPTLKSQHPINFLTSQPQEIGTYVITEGLTKGTGKIIFYSFNEGKRIKVSYRATRSFSGNVDNKRIYFWQKNGQKFVGRAGLTSGITTTINYQP